MKKVNFKIMKHVTTIGGQPSTQDLCVSDYSGEVSFRQDFEQRHWEVMHFSTPEQAFNAYLSQVWKVGKSEAEIAECSVFYTLNPEPWPDGELPVFKIWIREKDYGDDYCLANIVPTIWNGIYT